MYLTYLTACELFKVGSLFLPSPSLWSTVVETCQNLSMARTVGSRLMFVHSQVLVDVVVIVSSSHCLVVGSFGGRFWFCLHSPLWFVCHSMSKFAKRDFVQCPIFDPSKYFGPNVLPTRADVLQCCQEVRRQKGCLSEKDKEPSFGDIADKVRSKLIVIWESASIPTVSKQRIKECLTNLHKKYTTLKNLLKSKTTSQSNKDEKIAAFKEYCSELFNIAACKCVDLSRCSCPKEKKVPAVEHAFYLDQRGKRLMGIASVDVSEIKRIHKRAERNAKRGRLERGEGGESVPTASASTSASTIDMDIDLDLCRENHRRPDLTYLKQQ